MTNLETRLASMFAACDIVPFIGAGLSKGCGLPDWGALLDRLLERNGRREAIRNRTDFLRTAEYVLACTPDGLPGMVREIELAFKESLSPVSQSDAHLLVSALNAPILYTTNYDSLLEDAYDYLERSYQKVVSLDDVRKASLFSEGVQIVKFHGSLEKADSIVLTESAYFQRLDFESPLDIKLRSDLFGKNLIFLGYSFTDINIRYMLYRLRRIMSIHGGTPPEAYIVYPEFDVVSDTLMKRIGVQPIYLTNYSGQRTSERLISFLEQILHQSLRIENSFSMPIATLSAINQFETAVKASDQQMIRDWSTYLSTAQLGSIQLQRLLLGKGKQDLAFKRWWTMLTESSGEARSSLTTLMLSLSNRFDPLYIAETLVLGYLRYPDVREVVDDSGSYTWFHSIDRNPTPRIRRMLVADAQYWLAHGDFQTDTTLWYMILLHQWFYKSRRARWLLWDYYDRDDQLPDAEWLQENSSDMGRLCEALRFRFHASSFCPWPTH